jgi:hypothetical protein
MPSERAPPGACVSSQAVVSGGRVETLATPATRLLAHGIADVAGDANAVLVGEHNGPAVSALRVPVPVPRPLRIRHHPAAAR